MFKNGHVGLFLQSQLQFSSSAYFDDTLEHAFGWRTENCRGMGVHFLVGCFRWVSLTGGLLACSFSAFKMIGVLLSLWWYYTENIQIKHNTF